MLSAFVLNSGRLIQVRVDTKDDLTRKETIWIDLAYPTDEERELVQSVFPMELPEDEDLQDLQASARYYQDESGVHIRSTFIQLTEEAPTIVTMSFNLHEGRLLTVHDDDLTLLRRLRMQARAGPGVVDDAADILLGCYERGGGTGCGRLGRYLQDPGRGERARVEPEQADDQSRDAR